MAASQEARAVKKVLAAVSGFDFDTTFFAAMLTNEGIEANKRMFDIFLATARVWADMYDEGYLDETHPLFNMAVYCKRILEVIEPPPMIETY